MNPTVISFLEAVDNEEIKDNNNKSNSINDNENFFIRNIHLLLAVIWGLCALGIYLYNY
jgi:hypothetical protein